MITFSNILVLYFSLKKLKNLIPLRMEQLNIDFLIIILDIVRKYNNI